MRAVLEPVRAAVVKKLSRFFVLTPLFFLPYDRKSRVERWLRGREQYRKLQRADCVVVSFGKSGRTWLRVMLSRFYQVKHGLSERHLIGFDNLHLRNGAIPKIFFTHDNYTKDYTGNLIPRSTTPARRSSCWCGIRLMSPCRNTTSGSIA